MHRKSALSSTQEMYLKTVHQMAGARGVARVRDVATMLAVTPGTVSGVLKTLAQLGLVEHEPYGAAALTASGRRLAECVTRRFDTLRAVLVEVFGLDDETAAADACLMEHAVSPRTVDAMRRTLLDRRHPVTPVVEAGTVDELPLCRDCMVRGVCQAEADVAP